MWPFGRKNRMPVPPAIHPNDVDLVGPRDVEWWFQQSPKGVESLSGQDVIAKMAFIAQRVEEKGTPMEEAHREVWRWFPMYYLSVEERDVGPDHLSEDDKRLPFAVKDRVNRANTNSAIGRRLKVELPLASSANAWYREAIRRNEI